MQPTFSHPWLWRAFSSGTRRHRVRQMIDVSRERTSTKFHRLLLLGLFCGPENRRYVPPKRRLTSPQLQGVTFQTTVLSAISIRSISRSDNVHTSFSQKRVCKQAVMYPLLLPNSNQNWEAKLKLSLCLFTSSLTKLHEGKWASEGIAPCFLTSVLNGVVSFKVWPLNPVERASCTHPLDRMLSGPQSRSGPCGKEKIFHFQESNPCRSARSNTRCDIPITNKNGMYFTISKFTEIRSAIFEFPCIQMDGAILTGVPHHLSNKKTPWPESASELYLSNKSKKKK
jgi:hypothetical protein